MPERFTVNASRPYTKGSEVHYANVGPLGSVFREDDGTLTGRDLYGLPGSIRVGEPDPENKDRREVVQVLGFVFPNKGGLDEEGGTLGGNLSCGRVLIAKPRPRTEPQESSGEAESPTDEEEKEAPETVEPGAHPITAEGA